MYSSFNHSFYSMAAYITVMLTASLMIVSATSFTPTRWNRLNNGGDVPEVNMDFCQTAKYQGFHCEEYKNKVLTEDGYFLTMHRINGRLDKTVAKKRRPIFMQHGLLSSSYSFIMNPANESLPFIFSDAGFDVWFGNSRGNTYSLKHIKYNYTQKAFWDFSWQEMAMYDLPVSIDFVLKSTGAKSVPYIGHSQGTLIGFIHQALTKSDKISHLVALGPIFHLSHIQGPYKLLLPFTTILGLVFEDIDNGRFLPQNNYSRWEATHICNHPLLVDICEELIFFSCGMDSKFLNRTRMPVYFAHFPQGSSVRDILHYGQMVVSGKCSFYDFGSPDKNMKKYNSTSPPTYIAQDITTPVSLFAAEHDILADAMDIDYLRDNLPNLVNDVFIADWNHADFILATDTPTRLGELLIDILSNIKSET